MAQVLYSNLGMTRRLVDIVFAGSHDAGITSGSRNVKTQSKGIFGQARAGVRIFDLRIIARTVKGKTGGTKNAELVTYHAQGVKTKLKSRHMVGINARRGLEITTFKLGTFGLALHGILDDARLFVTIYPTEFLILKFDKCKNWRLIAETCIARLGTKIYTGGGNVNLKTLQQLAGKVICVFSGSGRAAIPKYMDASAGILEFRSLFDKNGPPKQYNGGFEGIQYIGKGGTNPFGFGTYTKKMKENIKKQSKLMFGMNSNTAPTSKDVLGMMYWTSTGTFQNIESRNDFNWKTQNVNLMRRLWADGLEQAIFAECMQRKVDPQSYSSGTQMKSFMPNMVMIDFADHQKCKTIYDLNTLASTLMPHYFLKYG